MSLRHKVSEFISIYLAATNNNFPSLTINFGSVDVKDIRNREQQRPALTAGSWHVIWIAHESAENGEASRRLEGRPDFGVRSLGGRRHTVDSIIRHCLLELMASRRRRLWRRTENWDDSPSCRISSERQRLFIHQNQN